ncbi:MAG: IPT/TIG domain-containing protein, partial [Actinomycetota bacterium]|nr:IPT/TIG domain-containing protein [Actinomycetota bacterium]
MRLSRWVAVVAMVLCLGAAPGAQAEPVVVGSTLEGDFRAGFVRNAGTFFNSALADPDANLVSPVDGIILRLNILGAVGGPYRLRVLSPEGGSVYRATRSSPPLTFGGAEPRFPALRIEAGETIALDLPAEGDIAAAATGPQSAFALWVPPLPAGAALPYTATNTGRELGFNVEVLPPPVIARVAPKYVDYRKGGRVKIFGENFARVRKVTFGGVQALRFRVVSEELIIASVGQRRTRLRTKVRVKTEAGVSAATGRSRFEFSSCRVPDLTGLRPPGARRALASVDC